MIGGFAGGVFFLVGSCLEGGGERERKGCAGVVEVALSGMFQRVAWRHNTVLLDIQEAVLTVMLDTPRR